jgi:membrane fusion protein, multidrug efflux system
MSDGDPTAAAQNPSAGEPPAPNPIEAAYERGLRDGLTLEKKAGEGGKQESRGDKEKDDEKKGGDKKDDQKGDGKKGDEKKKDGNKRSYLFVWIFAAIAVVVLIGVLAYHLLVGRYHVTTKDAYVNGDLIRLQPQVTGTVTLISADQTQPVRRGQLLVQIDPHDAEVALEQAKANLAQTVRDVMQLFAEERRQQAMLSAQESQLTLANKELVRDRALIASHGVSQEELDHMEDSARSATAGLRQARASLESVQAQIAGTEPATHPRVRLAESNLRSAWLARNRTAVTAPVSGYMVRRAVQLGEQVSPAVEMLAIAPLDSVWIDANFKETQLEKLRIGQAASVKTDIYGSDYIYHGRVLGLTAGTGSALALLPSENATGNWIKIVQRLPVRIGLDPRELAQHPLFLGLSTKVDVDVHDLNGGSLSSEPAWPAQMQTEVYAAQDAGVDSEIERIIRENLQGSAANPPSATPPVASAAQ